MTETGMEDAAALIPDRPTLDALRAAAAGCRACPLWRDATQTVFGEGGRAARVMMVGEQPGDQEDRQGRPFVGPAGRVLDGALESAGIDRSAVYVTNVVKHFKFELRGKRRIHQKPTRFEQLACRPWLEAELEQVSPEVLVLLGATAAQSLLGSKFRLTRHRGELIPTEWAPVTTATIHPSAVLRQRDDESRARERKALADDLRVVAGALADGAA